MNRILFFFSLLIGDAKGVAFPREKGGEARQRARKRGGRRKRD